MAIELVLDASVSLAWFLKETPERAAYAATVSAAEVDERRDRKRRRCDPSGNGIFTNLALAHRAKEAISLNPLGNVLAERESLEFVSRTVPRSPKFDWSPSGVREEWRTVIPRGCQAVH